MLTLSRTVADQGRLIAFSTRLLEKSGVKPLTARQTWRPWTSFRLGRVFSSLGVFVPQFPNCSAHCWSCYHHLCFASIRFSSRRNVGRSCLV